MSTHKILPLPPSSQVDSALEAAEDKATGAQKPWVDFSAIFHAHAAYAWRLLRRLGVAERDAHDVCHDVFVVIHRRLAHIRAPSSVKSFVYSVCVRTASDYRRSARVRREHLSDDAVVDAEAIPPSNMPDELVDQRRATAFLMSQLERMEDGKREVFVLYEMDELTMAEVAEIVGCPLQTAYSRLHAARKEIRAAFVRRETGNDR